MPYIKKLSGREMCLYTDFFYGMGGGGWGLIFWEIAPAVQEILQGCWVGQLSQSDPHHHALHVLNLTNALAPVVAVSISD